MVVGCSLLFVVCCLWSWFAVRGSRFVVCGMFVVCGLWFVVVVVVVGCWFAHGSSSDAGENCVFRTFRARLPVLGDGPILTGGSYTTYFTIFLSSSMTNWGIFTCFGGADDAM